MKTTITIKEYKKMLLAYQSKLAQVQASLDKANKIIAGIRIDIYSRYMECVEVKKDE